MDGPSLISFTVGQVPKLTDSILRKAGMTFDQIDLFLMHQATRKLLEQLQLRFELDEDRMPILLEHCGNTVSSTLPILIDGLRGQGRLTPGMRNLMVGFGVGWSWAGCVWTETWRS
jgi:3-oxoacyl-[acyl-carrier-protein] synthase-3